MQKNELIRLDATLSTVISESVFYAELDNGHKFVAVAKGLRIKRIDDLRPLDRVQVEFSPYTMSKARIVVDEEFHEG